MSSTVPIQVIQALQKKTDRIRNICVLAHVDHGKTTLCDSLIASNGIISKRLAGQVRYMDSRQDEQTRGITMKASSISLHYRRKIENLCDQQQHVEHVKATGKSHKDFLINLIDSPGHVDFSGEVETGIRISDGCLLVVDVVRGVEAQTKTVLRQLWREKLKPILVLNKIDRLYTELYYTSTDVWRCCRDIIGIVNAEIAALAKSEQVIKEEAQEAGPEEVDGDETQTDKDNNEEIDLGGGWSTSAFLNEIDDSKLYFDPAKNNVVFASAIGGWAFTIQDRVKYISSRFKGINEKALARHLFGDFYLSIKKPKQKGKNKTPNQVSQEPQKRIEKGAILKKKEPIFATFILKPLEKIIKSICVDKNIDEVHEIVKLLSETNNLKLHKSEITQNRLLADSMGLLKTIMTQWMPLSESVLKVIVDLSPSPLDISNDRIQQLISGKYIEDFMSNEISQKAVSNFESEQNLLELVKKIENFNKKGSTDQQDNYGDENEGMALDKNRQNKILGSNNSFDSLAPETKSLLEYFKLNYEKVENWGLEVFFLTYALDTIKKHYT